MEKCELKLLDPSHDVTECQLLVRLICKHGVRKTYKLQYETANPMRAMTDKSTSLNRLTVPAHAFKEVMDHFAPRAEELSMAVRDGDLALTSFTEGVIAEKEILKQPIHTSITIDRTEFTSLAVEEDIIITFTLREFKSVVVLCDSLATDMELIYATPERPLIVEFENSGLQGEFVVATVAGDRISRKPSPSRQKAHNVQHQPRIIRPDVRAEASGRTNVPTASPMPDWHDDSIPIPSGFRVDPLQAPQTLEESTRSAHDTPLFAPDPDSLVRHRPESPVEHSEAGIRDPSVYRLANAYAHQEAGSRGRSDEEGNDEMELYEDERNFEEDTDEEILGATQAPQDRPRSLFD